MNYLEKYKLKLMSMSVLMLYFKNIMYIMKNNQFIIQSNRDIAIYLTLKKNY